MNNLAPCNDQLSSPSKKSPSKASPSKKNKQGNKENVDSLKMIPMKTKNDHTLSTQQNNQVIEAPKSVESG